MTIDCCVFGCSNNNKKNPKLSFFSIPSVRKNQGKQTEELTERRRNAWLKAINRKNLSDQTVRKWHVVCSEHFLTGAPAYMHDEVNPDWVPSLKLGYGDDSQTATRSTVNRYIRQKRRKQCPTASDSKRRKVLLDANDAQSSQAVFSQQVEHDTASSFLRLTSTSSTFSDDEADLYDLTHLTESEKPREENLKEHQRLNVNNMEVESSAQTCDQTDPLQRMSHSDSKDHSVSRGARVLREAEEPQMFSTVDVKRRTMSSGIQCPYCRYRCGSRFSFQIHIGSQHPLHCEDTCVGRLGKVVFYQRTAKLFHCHICFFTSKDYAVLLEHLLARHCFTVKKAGNGRREDKSPNPEVNPGNEDTTEQCKQETCNKDSLKRKQSSVSSGEDEDVNVSDSTQAADEEQEAAVERYSENSTAPNYNCKFCKQRCTSKGSLLRHVSHKHDVPKPHACKECSETFMLESLLTHHVNLHHRQERYQCPYCLFESSLRGLHQHLSQCKAEGNDDKGDMGTEERE